MREFEINTPKRQAAFLAQVAHESGDLRYMEEPIATADYEGRADVGNTQPGDGKRYKPRGPLQLTGRANYDAYGQDAGIPLTDDPDALTNDPDTSADAAAWFMAAYNPAILPLLKTGDQDDFIEGANMVGYPGGNTTATRLMYWETSQQVLSGGQPLPPPTPSKPSPSAPLPGMVQMGSKSSDVTVLQALLNDAVDPPPALVVDGNFGAATKAAVQTFQKAHQLSADGVVGTATWSALLLT